MGWTLMIIGFFFVFVQYFLCLYFSKYLFAASEKNRLYLNPFVKFFVGIFILSFIVIANYAATTYC